MSGSYMVNNAGKRVCHRNHVMNARTIYVEKRKDGTVQEHCKTCRRENMVAFKERNPNYFLIKNEQFRKTDLYRQKTRDDRKHYRSRWIAYFNQRYGIESHCSICDKELKWISNNHQERVCFDHRHGNEAIMSKSPRTWIQNRPCNDMNIQLWESCDFGVLCNKCNLLLPTLGRKKFVIGLVKYLETCS